jgi:hypothetical protein
MALSHDSIALFASERELGSDGEMLIFTFCLLVSAVAAATHVLERPPFLFSS